MPVSYTHLYVYKRQGYSYREMIGFIASFCGGNAKFNRLGKLVIQQYAQTGKIVNPDVCASFEHKDVYTVSAIACKFGDVANTRGDSSANCVNFTNPYVDDSNIDSIFNLQMCIRDRFYPVGDGTYRFTMGLPPKYFVRDSFEFYKDKAPSIIRHSIFNKL